MSKLAPTLQAFFTDRLMGQRQASAHTIAGYRDTFRLLLRFAADRTRTQACELDFADLDAPLIAAFLTHLETERGNGVRTRNHRLAAIHSLFGYAALHHPEHAASIGLRTDTVQPRVHDLRHAFAVHTLIDAHHSGGDISALLPVLSTYLGHVEPANTYWYLSAVPELMQLVAARLEHHEAGRR